MDLAVPLAFGGLSATVATHMAVLSGALPHTAVCGGRVTDERTGRLIAFGSLLSLVPVGVLAARGAGWLGNPTGPERSAMRLIGIGGLISVPLQMGGSRFERTAMAPVAAALGIGFLRLAATRPE